MNSDAEFISSIHNYCDRWCERCEFTARCSVFAMEAETHRDENDAGNEPVVRDLQNVLAGASAMLEENAEGSDIDLDYDPGELAVYMKISEIKDDRVRSDDLARLAGEYSFGISLALDEAQKDWFKTSDVDEEIMQDVLGVISWYQYFISAKVRRGLHGILDDEGNEDRDIIRDTQSDANGSIKVALIAIERSILAWTYVLNENNFQVVRPIIETLESIKHKAEQRFPFANDFVRPGFDELETVM